MRNNHLPSHLPEEFSETAFITGRAKDFIRTADNHHPWCLHLSYIKPHWPLVAPAPYHNLYSARDILPAVKSDLEKQHRHPVVEAFARQEYSVNYSKEEVRRQVVPVYMGLVKQIDDQLGSLFQFMRDQGVWDNTWIVFTSDHGDYLGDHWLGEKDLFHDCSARIPLIVRPADGENQAIRKSKNDTMVESIDIVPTLIDLAHGEQKFERLEGRSLLSHLVDNAGPDRLNPNDTPREFVVSEIDYSDRGPRQILKLQPDQCHGYMLRSERWKYIFYEGFRPQLFDLEQDPNEFEDLAENQSQQQRLQLMQNQLFTWLRNRKIRTETPQEQLEEMGPALDEKNGIVIGRW